jgi:hypothetical protein
VGFWGPCVDTLNTRQPSPSDGCTGSGLRHDGVVVLAIAKKQKRANMKQCFWVGLPIASLIALVVGCVDTRYEEAEGACIRIRLLCSNSSTSSSVVVCSAKRLLHTPNRDDIVDCINEASDCDSALGCAPQANR